MFFYRPGIDNSIVRIYERKRPADGGQSNVHRILGRVHCVVQKDQHLKKAGQFMMGCRSGFVIVLVINPELRLPVIGA